MFLNSRGIINFFLNTDLNPNLRISRNSKIRLIFLIFQLFKYPNPLQILSKTKFKGLRRLEYSGCEF